VYSRNVLGLSMLRGWDEGYVVPSFGIVIDREWRSQGLGSALLTFTLDEARTIGAHRVRLSVYASHPSALQLYLKHGFVEQARHKVEVGSDVDEVVVLMTEVGGVACSGSDTRAS